MLKNTWIHSIVLILIASCVLILSERLSTSLIEWTAGSTSLLPAPVMAFSRLAPGLLLGWFTRRHPLVLGALAGALATFVAGKISGAVPDTQVLLGEVIAVAMIVAVAALAGRALRYRFQPTR